MADELDLDQLDIDLEKENKTEKRFKDLSEKVKLTSEERDAKDKLLTEQKTQNEALIKERDFLNSFGDQLGKYPDAVGFKDKIKEKVLKGYSVEDATTAVLVAEGKYTPPKVDQPIGDIAGGSASTFHQTGGEKPISEMTREEKRAKLVEIEQRGNLSAN